jgi:peptidoglycan/xylan/chitin deacetylase (PgdA/CDA1 family)
MYSYLRRFREIPVLSYHRVVNKPPPDSRFNVYITRDDLEWQLDSLSRRGYQTVTFNDLVSGVRPEKPVILTFDDGYEDNYLNLLPLLKRKDARAVIFALGDRAQLTNSWDMEKGEPEAKLMTDAQLKECHDSGRIEIGSHGLGHKRLTGLNKQELADEVVQSRKSLESVIKADIHSFAYPYGDYGEREVKMVEKAGYQFGIGVLRGPTRFADDLFQVRRIQIFPGTGKATFWKKTCGYYLRYCNLKGKGA